MYGPRYVVSQFPVVCSLYYHKLFKDSTFTFQGQEYRYFYHLHTATWLHERAVEVPIAWRLVKSADPGDVLEVGNVLSHYFPVRHQVVDKYDKASGVLNADIADFQSSKTFGAIVAVSTLEHVGWDETPRDPEKPLRAVENIRRLLSPGGTALITVPIGYNPNTDRFIREQRMFDSQSFMKRVSRDNRWIETSLEDALSAEFGRPFPFANALAIGRVGK